MQILYKYRLNEKCKESSRQIVGINLSKNWISYGYKYEQLTPFIRTKFNEDGIVDFEEYDVESKQVFNSSITDYEKEVEIHSREALSTMVRKELIPIAKSLQINPVNKSDIFLVREIIKRQSEYIEGKKQYEERLRLEKLSEELSKEQQVIQ